MTTIVTFMVALVVTKWGVQTMIEIFKSLSKPKNN